MKIKIKKIKPRNPFVVLVITKAVRKHKNKKKEAKNKHFDE